MGMKYFPALVKNHCGTFTLFKAAADSFQQRLNIIPRQGLGHVLGEYCFTRLALPFIHDGV